MEGPSNDKASSMKVWETEIYLLSENKNGEIRLLS